MKDFMDFGFILCEELVLRSQYYDAALLLIQIILSFICEIVLQLHTMPSRND